MRETAQRSMRSVGVVYDGGDGFISSAERTERLCGKCGKPYAYACVVVARGGVSGLGRVYSAGVVTVVGEGFDLLECRGNLCLDFLLACYRMKRMSEFMQNHVFSKVGLIDF